MSSFLSLYEPLDVIGTGSFGVIRKVRRKSDGLIFARKELKFERMSDRDKKLIVSEVNILKDLHHEHIVRYHDRYVDRDAGIMYILMEYCGSGDLSGVIKQAQRHGRPIPEDTVWNYFMQILLALNYCHHPTPHGRTSTGSSGEEGRDNRPPILHRDLKPDNIFLDENHIVKLGDFGLSKALTQASFAQTYVGTPYYMSPELMQEKSYDSKSDIWSLGCLIYELCALKPPFHEAKTHAELSILIRAGRIPPLPKCYSPALTTVIKSMLNLNPAMRPSAAFLLQNERIDLAHKVTETQKMLNTVKAHKASVAARERDVEARESLLAEKEAHFTALLSTKDTELASLRALLATAESAHVTKVRDALAKREEELRQMVLKQESEVAARMARREEEIMDAVRRREEEIGTMWAAWERETRAGMARAVDERMAWVQARTDEIEAEAARLESMRAELEARMEALEERERRASRHGHAYGAKAPLEEVQNILAPSKPAPALEKTPARVVKLAAPPPAFATPIHRAPAPPTEYPSAMKGVIMTATGEPLATPSPSEFAKLFADTPRVALNFAQIFEFDSEAEDSEGEEVSYEAGKAAALAAAPAPALAASGSRGGAREKAQAEPVEVDSDTDTEDVERTPRQPHTRPATRLRRPSMRTASSSRPKSLMESAIHVPTATTSAAPAPTRKRSKSRSRPPSSAGSSRPPSVASSRPAPPPPVPHPQPTVGDHPRVEYDLSDEENLPSPFLKKIERERITRTTSVPVASLPAAEQQVQPSRGRGPPRKSTNLRAVAVVNAAHAAGGVPTSKSAGSLARAAGGGGRTASASAVGVRSSIAKAQRASEEARKALFRP